MVKEMFSSNTYKMLKNWQFKWKCVKLYYWYFLCSFICFNGLSSFIDRSFPNTKIAQTFSGIYFNYTGIVVVTYAAFTFLCMYFIKLFNFSLLW